MLISRHNYTAKLLGIIGVDACFFQFVCYARVNATIPSIDHFDNAPIKMIGLQSVLTTPKSIKNNFNILVNSVLLFFFN